MDYFHIGTDLFIGFFALFLMTKVLGKTQITQITAFDFISALVLGELVGNAVYDEETGIGKIIFAVTLWGALIYIIEIITQKMKGSRNFLEGQPSIIIRKGKIDKEQMTKCNLDINQLQHLLRMKDVFSLREVEFAILETDGTVSVLRKSLFETATRGDLKLVDQRVSLPITLIIDGEVLWDNLDEGPFEEGWLKNEIRTHGATSYRDIMYAEWRDGEGLYVQTF
ncbi:DUF421 domain-containing protein [Bacillus timonensis]|nr:DUF421 domain-containing protein [Bacillus timonensis]